ncbi:MAG: type restriction enzyme subunit [Thauera sp.]|nr:restriction endonuclease subunit S [Thauera sp.]MDI3491587.1 type restriction enzyme subunit [Thauera sp.]
MSGLPEGWANCELSDVVEVLDAQRIPLNSGERAARTEGKPESALFPYYGATGLVGYVDDYIFDEPLILLGEDGVPFLDLYRRKAYRISGKAWVNNHAHVLRPISWACDSRFIEAYLNCCDYAGHVTGTTRLKLTQAAMNRLPLPLAPLPEQKRIADKFDSVLARVDACRDRLDRIPALFKRFRQSVLAAAMSGQLTGDWRETLERDCEGWDEAPLGQIIIEMRNGLSPKPSEQPPGAKILRISAVRPGKIALADHRYLEVDQASHQLYALKQGDLLFTRYNGTLEFVGVCARVPADLPDYVYPDKLIRVRVNKESVSPQFVELAFGSESARRQVEEFVKSSAGQKGIAGGDLKSVKIPVPPLAEQHEIVRRVETLFAFADRLEARCAAARKQAGQLTPALLAKAFRGELVPQDPADEPAAELLKRLAASRAEAPKARRGKARASTGV